jgi:hypothetical protein
MRFFKLFVFFISFNLFANPLSINLNFSKEDMGGEEIDTLNFIINSSSLETTPFLAVFYFPKGFEILEGKRTFKGDIEPLKYFKDKIFFKLKENIGEIKVRLYVVNESGSADINTQRIFSATYELKEEGLILSEVLEREYTKKEKTEDEKEEEELINNDVDIVIKYSRRPNVFFKYFLGFISLSILFVFFMVLKNKRKK